VWDRKNSVFYNDENHEIADYKELSFHDDYNSEVGHFFSSLFEISTDENFVIQQFTGLKDCQGKEIYEGDIVFVDEDFWMVVFEEGLFGLKFNEEDKVSPLYQYADCCVHGNIFENKGLICEN
jgi:uncharacterized phage protein (TIGR01671 family)